MIYSFLNKENNKTLALDYICYSDKIDSHIGIHPFLQRVLEKISLRINLEMVLDVSS